MSKKATFKKEEYDVICVGAGIMSTTLALMLKLLDPNLRILILERLEKVAQESSAAQNNAGTGHSGFCELNYTPQKDNGQIEINKAIKVFEQFERSKQFWRFLVKNDLLEDPSFIHSTPHHAWVTGDNNVDFLKKRFKTMQAEFMFQNMEFTENKSTMRQWFPLIMKDRDPNRSMAATRMELGTEVNFGSLTRKYLDILQEEFNVPVLTEHEVTDIDPDRPDDWLVEVENLKNGEKLYYDADHVFIGAGGGALPLLQKVEIDEKDGYGGFPISGQWLFCKNEELIKQHNAKVYSKAEVGSPPMSVPHLDTRYINGKKELMFGPFAGFSTKFLKEGSYTDFPKSINFSNIPSLWGVFWHNLDLTKYLVEQVSMGHEDRVNELRTFLKDAKPEDWELQVAGQRVQIIKRDQEEGGTLEFGTDVIHNKDGSITTLLGASPGASVAVDIMLDVIKTAFSEKLETGDWKKKLSGIIPFWNKGIKENKKEFLKLQAECSEALGLNAKH